MLRSVRLLFAVALAVLFLPSSIGAQAPAVKPSAASSPPAGVPSALPLTLKAHTRMVNLEVVAEDKAGHPITGLTADDFRIFEQTPEKSRNRLEQKIAVFREVHTATLKPLQPPPNNPAEGLYTNAVASSDDIAPPTVLVVDGVNTEIEAQAQVHVQMLKILRQLPPNVPVAVFLMGDRLTLLQGFTTDPKLLQQALAAAHSLAGHGLINDPRWDPDSPQNLALGLQPESSQQGGSHAELTKILEGFELDIYGFSRPRLIRMTCDDFIAIARSLQGYPGRKNLLWLSTSFPLAPYLAWSPGKSVHPRIDDNLGVPGFMQVLDNALSDARIAIYPIDLAGVTTLQSFSAQTRLGNQPAGSAASAAANALSSANGRQLTQEFGRYNVMDDLAKATGGKVCVGDNDLGDCVRKAVIDSSDFYEISYYPSSPDWNGEFRRISVEIGKGGLHLSYRQGYYATPDVSPEPHRQADEMKDHCRDMLDATAVAFTARTLSADGPGQMKFSLEIDPRGLTIASAPDGVPALNLEIGFCTFDRRGDAQKLMIQPVNLKLDKGKYSALLSGERLRDMVSVPAPQPAAIRLLVKDVPTGRLGSIYINTTPSAGKLNERPPGQSPIRAAQQQ